MNRQDYISDSENNSDIYFDYISQEQDIIQKIKVSCPVILFMYSGKLTIRYKSEQILAKKGECIFIQANTIVTFHTSKNDEESFCGIYVGFSQSFLSEFYYDVYDTRIMQERGELPIGVMKMPCTPYMQSLYISMVPYLEQKTKPEKNLMELKRQECIYCMLTSDSRFYSSLFAFIKPIEQEFFYLINKPSLN